MKYEIIASGSTGNAVIFNDSVLVDCGVGFTKLAPFYQKLRIVLLTHIHSDHFNKATIRKLAQERPTLRFACGSWLVVPLLLCGVDKRNIDLMEGDKGYVYPDVEIDPFVLEHDVPNFGYRLRMNGETIVYATDTGYMPDSPRIKKCDFYFIEANYKNTEELEERIRGKINNGEYAYEERLIDRHMSQDYAEDWLVQNGRPDSKHVFLHRHKEEEK